jgi:hypothetical protein
MILNEDVPRRLSRWAVVPVAALSLTVFSGFSFAQERGKKKESSRGATSARKIQKDVLRTVNEHLRKSLGRKYQVESLEDIDRSVKRFVRDQQNKKRRGDTDERVIIRRGGDHDLDLDLDHDGARNLRRAIERARREMRRDDTDRKRDRDDDRRVKVFVHGLKGGKVLDLDGLEHLGISKNLEVHGENLEEIIRKAMKSGLRGAKIEIHDDADLRKLGIADDVEVFVEDILGDGKAGEGLHGIIRKAMKHGLHEAKIEIHNDADLRKLGITGDVEVLLEGILGSRGDGKAGEGLHGIIRKAMKHGLEDAKIEIRTDTDLKRLGLTGDVEVMLEGILGGEDEDNFRGSLEAIIRKSLKHATGESGDTHSDDKDGHRKSKKKLKRKTSKGRSKIL